MHFQIEITHGYCKVWDSRLEGKQVRIPVDLLRSLSG